MKYLILMHLVGACIWVGGHLYLAIAIVPKCIKNKNSDEIMEFESKFEAVGLPALATQIITGILMSMYFVANFWDLFKFDSYHNNIIAAKLIFLLITILLALNVKLRILKNYNESKLRVLAFHIYTVTALSLLFLLAGLSFRFSYF